MAKIVNPEMFGSLVLQKLQYAVKQAFGQEILTSVDMEEYRDHMFDRMVYDMRTGILAEEVAQESVTVEMEQDISFLFPTNFYQHAKQQWNGWFVKRRAARVGWLNRMLIRRVKVKAHWRTARKTQVVRTVQFAAFPAATIQTSEKFRGPIMVRKERVDVGGV